MSKRMITIHNAETDEIIVREMTDEEIAIENAPGKYDKEIAEQEKIRKSALAKLAALGLTEDEIAAL